MPGGDRTGPAGMGPMTGRAMGDCAGYAGAVGGRGPMGRGPGHGWRRMGAGSGAFGGARADAVPPASPGAAMSSAEQQLDALKAQAEGFGEALAGIRRQIANIEARNQKD